jgi:tetratricopeptide (TPR) repeat protein
VHLIEQVGFSRYQLHDLVRSFAAEQDVGADDEGPLRRLMTFYVQAVVHASAIATANANGTAEQREPDVPLPVLPDPTAAMAWLDSELPNIVAIVQHAADHGPRAPAWEISRRLTHYFWIRRSVPEWRAINEAALAAARAADQPEAVAAVLNALAVTTWTTNDLNRARSLFEEALTLNGRLGREAGQASNHTNLGSLCRQTGQLAAAFAHTRTAIQLGRRLNRALTVANALLNLGNLRRDFGALYEASRTVDRALDAYRTLGSTDGQVSSLNLLATIRCELGHYRAAESAAEEGLRIADAFGSVHGGIFARPASDHGRLHRDRPGQGQPRTHSSGIAKRGRTWRPSLDHYRYVAAGGRAGRHEQQRQSARRDRTRSATGHRATRPAWTHRRFADHGAVAGRVKPRAVSRPHCPT